jgi:hypothetical protein
MKKLIYIGDRFYSESGTMMSSVYEIVGKGEYRRSDWGWIGIALQNGQTIRIRPANKKEITYFERRLREYKEYRKETPRP